MMDYLDEKEMLKLPKSIKSYIMLRDYVLNHSADPRLYRKLIYEYLSDIPVFELMELLVVGKITLGADYQKIVEFIFQCASFSYVKND